MSAPRLLVLVEPQTPAHWVTAIVNGTQVVFPEPVTVDVRIVIAPTSFPDRLRAAFNGLLGNMLLRIDRRFRALGRLTSGTAWPPAERLPHPASPNGPSSKSDAREVRTSRARWEQLHFESSDVIISTLYNTESLLDAVAQGGSTIVWAECDGHVLGGSSSSFLPAIAARAITIDVTVRGASPGISSRTVIHSRCAMRSVSPSLNEELLAARVGDLLCQGAAALLDRSVPEPSPANGHGVTVATTSRQVSMRTLYRVAARRISVNQGKPLGGMRWGLGYRRSGAESVEESFAAMPEMELLIPPAGTGWADPFPVRHEGRDLIFFEQELASEGKGHIAMTELLADGRMGPVERVLTAPFHLSYPCVFNVDGEWFMVPESRATERVSLYRAVEFPYKWACERDLIAGCRLADATPFQYDGRWWLLACRIGAGESTHEDLMGYSAPSLFGPWKPVSRLPIASDVTAGRPAGQLIQSAGRLLRPAQDGSRRYGYGLALREITLLEAARFAEREYLRAAPSWSPDLRGVHTFNRSSSLTLIDVLRAGD